MMRTVKRAAEYLMRWMLWIAAGLLGSFAAFNIFTAHALAAAAVVGTVWALVTCIIMGISSSETDKEVEKWKSKYHNAVKSRDRYHDRWSEAENENETANETIDQLQHEKGRLTGIIEMLEKKVSATGEIPAPAEVFSLDGTKEVA